MASHWVEGSLGCWQSPLTHLGRAPLRRELTEREAELKPWRNPTSPRLFSDVSQLTLFLLKAICFGLGAYYL